MPTQVTILTVPYDAGRVRERMGRGPQALLEAGLAERLAAGGREVRAEEVRAPEGYPLDVGTTFAVARVLAERVAVVRKAGAFPLIVAGQCSSSIGTVSALPRPLLVVWFDAHGDFNTPETTPTGFMDGMAITAIAGRCWGPLTRSVPGFRPVDEERIVLVGARDIDADEAELLATSGVHHVTVADLRKDGAGTVGRVARESGAAGVYLHVDLDVLDTTAVGRANSYAVPGGLTVDEVVAVLDAARVAPVVAGAVTAYDPAGDPEGRIPPAALAIAEALLPERGAA